MTDLTRAQAFATPTTPAGSTPYNSPAVNGTVQIKNAPGVLTGVSVNTAGLTSAVALYDGTAAPVTITIAAPGVISWTGHPFVAGGAVVFQTTGALPTGLTAGTKYYVSTVGLTANAFSVADTQAHALAGTNTITTTGSQSGTQTAFDESRPIGTYSTLAQGGPNLGANGIYFPHGLIGVFTGGTPADVSVLYV